MYGSPNVPISDPDAEGDPNNLEAGTWGDTDAEHVQCSIAISLKRIADYMHGNPERCGVLDSLANIADRMPRCGS